MSFAIGYIRVSTDRQANEGVSVELQIAKIRQYCELHGLSLAGIYGDPGISGATIKKRPGLQAVLEIARSARIGAVVIYKLDRLARNTREALDVAELLRKSRVGLHSICEKLDTDSAIGEFFFTLMASLAQMERRLIGERTKAAMAHLKANGRYSGGEPNYGYRLTADGKGVEPDPYEWGLRAWIREAREKRLSRAEIIRICTERGWLNRKGKPFAPTQIDRICKGG